MIQAVPIDQEGIFETQLNVVSPQLVNVAINDVSKRFYVVPEQTYTLHISKKEIFIEEEKSPGLNHFIETVEDAYEKLARKNCSSLREDFKKNKKPRLFETTVAFINEVV